MLKPEHLEPYLNKSRLNKKWEFGIGEVTEGPNNAEEECPISIKKPKTSALASDPTLPESGFPTSNSSFGSRNSAPGEFEESPISIQRNIPGTINQFTNASEQRPNNFGQI